MYFEKTNMQQPKPIKLSLIPLLIIAAVWGAPVASGFASGQFSIPTPSTIIDQAGRPIVIQEPFKRVISLYGAHTENLFSLGLFKEIIGVSQHDDYPAQAMSKPVFSYHDDPEKFLAARPDLVLIRPMIDRGYPQFVTMLEKSGITIVSLQPGTIDEMFTYLAVLGILTGKQDRAQQLISQFNKSIGEFKDLIGSRVNRKRVYFEAIHSKMKTFAPDSMAIFALESAGGINIAADADPVRNTNIAYYGKERILSHAPEIDVYLAQYGTMNRPTLSIIKQEPGFNIIKAVAMDQIYIVDEKIVSRPTMRLLEGIYLIGKYLYPKIFDEKASKILKR
ncbi:Vitamin B12 ABC transporter, substrate-binding protein BtuF [Olavius sp. associated proteobacterium Delta 1]|nr:Vitamin B12 ABC transporter, substrate-binding protein BtuF [Olavius sp. associated proteobacterium Delta 1]